MLSQPCEACPEPNFYRIFISASGADGGQCVPCTICTDGGYLKECTSCNDAICTEPTSVSADFIFLLASYLWVSVVFASVYITELKKGG